MHLDTNVDIRTRQCRSVLLAMFRQLNLFINISGALFVCVLNIFNVKVTK